MIREILNGSWYPVYDYSFWGFIVYVLATLIIELGLIYMWFSDSKEITKIMLAVLSVNLISGFIGFLIYFLAVG